MSTCWILSRVVGDGGYVWCVLDPSLEAVGVEGAASEVKQAPVAETESAPQEEKPYYEI